MCNLVHLHVHSEFSELDGLSKVQDLVARAKEIGSTALALTDHGVMGGIPDFITACEQAGIKPIPGVEAYMTRNRLLKGEFLKERRLELCEKYKIKEKVLKTFIRTIEKQPASFMDEATELLKDYLMAPPSGDLFHLTSGELSKDDVLKEFHREVYDYLSYDNYHIVLLAMNNQGLEDLYAIISDAHLHGFYSDPRTDLAFIRDHGLGKNLIATSACLGSWFARLCLAGLIDDAVAFIEECKETFHAFYLEKQATHLPEQIQLNQIIDDLAARTNTPKIITTDAHYARQEDIDTHDILISVNFGKCVLDPDRLRYAPEFWMKSEEEVRSICDDEEAILNTKRIAEMVNVALPKEPLFPKFIVEEGDSPEEILRKTAWDALFHYVIKKPVDLERYCQQLAYELDVITSLGFADYFLVVSDYIRWAKQNGYEVGPGRGSAAGSLVAFMLDITTLDPIKNNLMFERFLNPERAGYPDIDADFSYEAAKAVQQYLKDKYGQDRVAQIGTYGTFAARKVCRAVGKALGYSDQDQDKFAKAIPARPNITLEEAYNEEPLVQAYARQHPDWWNAMKKLEGHISHHGVHAGGVVLSPVPLTKVVPLRLDSEGLATTQYDMEWIEKFLVKFDILKLDTLDLIKYTMQYAGIYGKVDLNEIDLNDPKVYEEIYNKLNLAGIFQCESKLYHDIISAMKPNCFEDISVIVALGRPGPLDLIPDYIDRKWGRKKVEYPLPELEPILKDTYGVWVYQEQMMQASVILGGLTRGQSDMIRKGVAKKKHDLMHKWIDLMIYGSERYKEMRREHNAIVNAMKARGEEVPKEMMDKYDPDLDKVPYVEGAINRGFDEATLLKIKEDWIKFGNYCFNRAHSAAYAKLSVQTAWLKTYYPVEFMAALLTIAGDKKAKDGTPKTVLYMQECEKMGIKILPPDINESNASWTPVVHPETYQNHLKVHVDLGTKPEEVQLKPDAIRFGLGAIAGISKESVDEIIKYRPYTSVDDVVERVSSRKINKSKIVALIKSGAFDSINPNRNLLWRNYIKSRGEDYEAIPARTTKKDIMSYEREYLGTLITVQTRWDTIPNGKEDVQITGYVLKVEPFTAKKTGKEHCRVLVETQEDERNVLVFGTKWQQHKGRLAPGLKVIIKGKKSGEDLLADSIHYVMAGVSA
ncbi:DNA polymerase III subunit alpha [Alicyclobacillus shizuokensis]|uniref:DNA polymerase III subunit alpha n=1 Tax=Alicyclobacillus shizuokensis TaxID=392014 RepID=UPI000830B23F|nr:DNA polymerase III subunit alpha [Alicyclobacillus shizuokensis]